MKHDLACLPTGVGSLPHTSSKGACELILSNLEEIPFWPQLSNLSFKENMYAQFSYPLPGFVIEDSNKRVYIDTSSPNESAIENFLSKIIEEDVDHFAYDKEYFHGLYEILGMEESFRDIKMFKGQITGPISLGFQVTDENRKPIFYNDIYRELMVKNLKMMAKWQERALRKLCDNTMIYLDEPYLSMIGSAFVNLNRNKVIEHINEVLSGIEGLKAIHCCANTDWSLVLDTDIDVLNFDAYGYVDTLFLYADELIKFLEEDGMIAWGIVPTNEEDLDSENEISLSERLENHMNALAEKGTSLEKILKSSIITPSCGLGSKTERCAEKAIVTTKEVSRIMRERHGF